MALQLLKPLRLNAVNCDDARAAHLVHRGRRRATPNWRWHSETSIGTCLAGGCSTGICMGLSGFQTDVARRALCKARLDRIVKIITGPGSVSVEKDLANGWQLALAPIFHLSRV
jgi:hypothetical protein